MFFALYQLCTTIRVSGLRWFDWTDQNLSMLSHTCFKLWLTNGARLLVKEFYSIKFLKFVTLIGSY